MKKSARLELIKSIPLLPYQKFHEQTAQRSTRKLLPQPKIKLPQYNPKVYPAARSYPLPNDDLSLPLGKSLLLRRSSREFSGKPLAVTQLGPLLHYAAGLKPGGTKRFYPSAGARYPLELYFIALNTDLPKALYHYDCQGNCLEEISGLKTYSSPVFLNQEWPDRAGGIIAVTALFMRTTVKYGDRSYRYALLEAGHVVENLSLITAALGLNGCTIGGFADKKVNAFLGINGVTEAALCLFALGSA